MRRSIGQVCRGLVLLTVCGWLALQAEFAPAQSPYQKYPAATDLRQVDADFPFQGEFEGKIPADDPNGRIVALQVRVTGKERFQAAQYDSGLPGETPESKRLTWLVGKRFDDLLVLSGGPWIVVVRPDACRLLDSAGQLVGQLARVHRESPTLGVSPPKQATVLFDGSNTDNFVNGRLTDSGLLMQGTNLRPMYQDFDLHLEFILPYMPSVIGQMRANSGVYLQSRYEVQILDSFALSTTFNGCGAIYRYRKPDLNLCLPPLVWQTYDISFTSPRWASDGRKLQNARATIWLNGVKVQDNVAIETKTGNGAAEDTALLPIKLQEHGTPVRFRNIWIIDRGVQSPGAFPVLATEEEKAKARASTGAYVRPEAAEPPAAIPPAAPAEPAAAPPAEASPLPEAKPAETKPAETKPAETKPAETPASEPPAGSEAKPS